jgi:hypothetical protein
VRDSLGQRNLESEQRFSFDPWCQERDLRLLRSCSCHLDLV